MGYYSPKNKNLMWSIAGKTYIDARLSFNSYLPKKLKKILEKKSLIFGWIN